MKYMRVLALTTTLGVLLMMAASCGGKTPSSSTQQTTAASTAAADSDVTDNGEVPSGDTTQESLLTDAQGEPVTQAPGETKASSGNATTKGNTPTTASAALNFGVTNTKKMPNYISKITSPTLTVLASDKGNPTLEAAQRSAFKAVTGKNIEIKRTVVDWNSMPDRLAAMVMAEAAPDMFSYYGSSAAIISKRPYWENIEKYIDIDDALWKGALEMNSSALFSLKGIKYAVVAPSYTGVGPARGYFYNTKLVQEAIQNNPALKDPVEMFKAGKWTWDTLYQFAQEITYDEDGDGTPEIYGHSIEWSRMDVSFLVSAGQDIVTVNKDGTLAYNLENANLIRALNMYFKLLKLSNVPAPWEGLSMVVNGKAGFSYGHAYWMASSEPATAAKKAGKIKWVPFPRDPKSSTYYTDDQLDAMFIPKGAKNPYLAGAWYYFQQYLQKNPVAAVTQATKKQQKEVYGWSDAEIELYTGKVVIPNTKKIVGGIGLRLDGFNFGGFEVKANTVVSQMVESVSPKLKQAIQKFNSSIK